MRFSRVPTWDFPNYLARLPDHYYKHIMELKKPKQRIHEIFPKGDLLDFKKDPETNIVKRIPDAPIQVIYPKEADLGLWGGEGVIKGYVKLRKYFYPSRLRSRIWFPNLYSAVFYSEILDKYLKIICTKRTLDLVDAHYGFDAYILRTPVQDLASQLALHLRRFMLIKLAKNDFSDPEIGKEMIEKYKDCIIPLEEAEWFGLTVRQAITKQKILEAETNKPIPLKVKFAQELIEELNKMRESGELEIAFKDEKKKKFFDRIKSKLPFV